VQAAGDASEVVRFKAAQHDLNSRDRATQDFAIGDIGDIVRRALAIPELQAPAAVQGAFIPTGNAYDALIKIAFVGASRVGSAATRIGNVSLSSLLCLNGD